MRKRLLRTDEEAAAEYAGNQPSMYAGGRGRLQAGGDADTARRMRQYTVEQTRESSLDILAA
jgi:hypothetical protein